MKKVMFIGAGVLMAASAVLFAADTADVKVLLPAPDKTGGKSIMQSLTERKTSRDFDKDKGLSDQELSNLLYAAWGINRPDEGKHTVPTARNVQEIVVLVAMPDGVYKYAPEKHELLKMTDKDIRKEIGGRNRMTATAGAVVILASDSEKIGGDTPMARKFAAFHAGSVSQSISLYCASEGLGTVVVGSYDEDSIRKNLNLPESWWIQVIQPVGHINK